MSKNLPPHVVPLCSLEMELAMMAKRDEVVLYAQSQS
jgi:hypothetical protein